MPCTMTKRQRVERAMACQETDRVPVYDLLRCDAAFAHFSGRPLPPLATDAATLETLEGMVGKAVDAFCDMTRSVGFGPVVAGESTDGFGFVHQQAPFEKTSWITRRPFDDQRGAVAFLEQWTAAIDAQRQEIERHPGRHRDQYHQAFQRTQARIGDTVNLLAQHGLGLDDIRHRLGLELFAYVAADAPELIGAALEAMTRRNIAECHAIADVALSPAVLTYGDIACKDRLLHAPDWLRAEFLPRLQRLNEAWHEHGLLCLFHSDGNLMEIMDDLVATGIDGLNPIETVAGMDLGVLRRRYGDRLFLAGGIDMSQLLSNGTPEGTRAVCRQAIRDAYPGLLMGSTTEADNSCRLENLIVMWETAREALPGAGG